MARILVTGGCGYIGSHTLVDLLDLGHEVVSIDNHINSSPDVLDAIEEITGTRVHNLPVDLSDRAELLSALDGYTFDGIIHFAALKNVGESVEQPLQYYDNNLIGMLNLLTYQRSANVPTMIFSSSCSVYGNPTSLPVTEDFPIAEAESPYARTKQMCEDIITDFAHVNPDLRYVLLRYFNPAGAHPTFKMGESPINKAMNLVPIITETAIGRRDALTVFGTDYDTRDGSCIRDYIHIMDLARAHSLGYQYASTPDTSKNVDIFNLGSGTGTTVLEMIEAFERVSGQKLPHTLGPRRAGDVVAIYADYSKAQEVLQWNPGRTIDDIMQSAWQWEQARRTD